MNDDKSWWPLGPHLRRGPEVELRVKEWITGDVSVSRSWLPRPTLPATRIASLAFRQEVVGTGARAIFATRWVIGPVRLFLQAVAPMQRPHPVPAVEAPPAVTGFWPWLQRFVPARGHQVAELRDEMNRVGRRLAALEQRVA